jgi:hypothetical protein
LPDQQIARPNITTSNAMREQGHWRSAIANHPVRHVPALTLRTPHKFVHIRMIASRGLNRSHPPAL